MSLSRIEQRKKPKLIESVSETVLLEPDPMLVAFVDEGSEFEGKLRFDGTVRIDGRFKGEIVSGDTLIVGPNAGIDASICCAVAIVRGFVVGDIVASERIVIHAGAHVEGDIDTPSLRTDDGASCNGRLTIRGKVRHR